MFEQGIYELLGEGIVETLYMTIVSTAFAYIFGLPLGVLLCVTDKDGIFPIPIINKVLGFIINLLRSVPFLILLVFILPFTRMIVGTTIGSTATIVPLVVASTPFVARMVESSLKEAAQSMGSSVFKIIYKVLIPEAKPSLLMGAAIAITTILGYSAMAGFVGGGGLGAIAVNYGYYRYQQDVMTVTVLLLVIVVQIFQEVGTRIARLSDRRAK